MAGKDEVKERKKREKKSVKKRRKKEREEREGDLRYRIFLFGATCIRGDLGVSRAPLGKNNEKNLEKSLNLNPKMDAKAKKIDVKNKHVLRYVF